MSLSPNEIKARAARFADEWRDAHYEKGETHTFYNEFFEIFGVNRRRVASYEEPVKLLGNNRGFIDLFWKGVLIVEQKSAVVDVLSAYVKANGTAAAGKLQWRKAVADEKSALAAARPVRALLKTFLQSRLGKASPQLNGFGFETTKAPRASAKTKAAAVDKNKATRAARHTMGTTQRKRVKAPTPPSPEPVPTASTQPAQPAPAGVKPA